MGWGVVKRRGKLRGGGGGGGAVLTGLQCHNPDYKWKFL